jgi:hypothetical protein
MMLRRKAGAVGCERGRAGAAPLARPGPGQSILNRTGPGPLIRPAPGPCRMTRPGPDPLTRPGPARTH